MNKRVKIGLAGCGSVSQRGLLPHLSQPDIQDRVELRAVMDVVAERARASAEKFGAAECYADYEEMLDKSDLDAVVIASPIGVHFQQGMKAVAAGKHVHLNKTMTTTSEEANQLIEASRKAGVILVASPGQMQWPAYQQVKKLVEEGVIGRVYWALIGRSWIGHEYEGFRRGDDILSDVDPLWYYQRRAGGGPMYDMTVYSLHTLTGILGSAQRVCGLSGIGLTERHFKDRRVQVDMDDNTHLLLDFGDSVYGQVYGTFASGPRRPELQISGSGGSIDVGWQEITIYGDPSLLDMTGAKLSIPVRRELPYVRGVHKDIEEFHVYNDIMHLVDCIREGKRPTVTAEHARHVIEIIEKGYESARTGRTVELITSF